MIIIYFALSLAVIAVFGNDYRQGSFFHIYFIIFALILPCILYDLTKTSPHAQRKLIFYLSLIMLLLVLSRFISWGLIVRMRFVEILPLHACNLLGLSFFFGVWLEVEAIKNIGASLGFLGGVLTLLVCINHGNPTIFSIVNMDSYLLHMLLVACPIYLVLTNQIRLQKRYIIFSATFFVPYYLFLVFFNHHYNTKFFFTSPTREILGDIYSILPHFKVFGVPFNPLYYLLIIGASLLLSLLSLQAFAVIQRRIYRQ